MGYEGSHIYRVYLPHKNRVVRSSSVTFDELGTFLTTPISEEEGGDDDICWVPLEELHTEDTTPEVSRALKEGNEASRSLQEADEVSRASQSGGDSQSGGASGDQDIAPQPNRPPLTDEEQAGLNQQELPDLGGHLRQEGTPSRDIYQEDLEQNLAEYSEDEAEPIQASLDARDMVNARTRSKPRLDYSVLHKTGRKELATKATYLTPAFAYTFASALSQPQWTRTTKGLPPEPRNWKEAMNSVFKKEWKTAADEEWESQIVNASFKIVELPPGAKALPVKWVFTYKFDENNVLFRWKARLVLRGDKQRPGIDYGDTFASVVRPSTFKLLMALVAVYDLECEHLDVITAFLNGKLDRENIYIQLPEEIGRAHV